MAVKVNHVWFSDDPMGALEKFNIYSWLALGHEVTIYAHRWNGAAHDEDSLGLSGSGVKVENVNTILAEDDNTRAGTLPNTRALLKDWIEATKQEKPSDTDPIYNMVDITKSYIGGTRQGIVLDLKVGPSPHLAAYADALSRKFISYSRGGNTAGPENQCIGTMQEDDTLRGRYAAKFEQKVTANLDGERGLRAADERHFGLITSFHTQGFVATKSGIDVAKQAPGGALTSQYEVKEIRRPGHGPFRVFKASEDQTNKSSVEKTSPAEVAELCQYVWDNELEGKDVPNHKFLDKVKEALKTLSG